LRRAERWTVDFEVFLAGRAALLSGFRFILPGLSSPASSGAASQEWCSSPAAAPRSIPSETRRPIMNPTHQYELSKHIKPEAFAL
jgi:hypothetical protein